MMKMVKFILYIFLPITLIVSCDTKQNIAPTVEFVSPVADGKVSGNVTLTAVGQAYGDGSTVNRVEKVLMLVNGTTVEATRQSSGAKPRFSYVWNTAGLADGRYEIQASVTDTEMNSGRTQPIIVNIENGSGNGPQTIIQTPTNGEVLNGQVAIVVNPVENQAPIASVDIVMNGVTVATVSAAPYVYRWETVKFYNGTYRVEAKAKGTDGKIRFSTPITVSTNGGLP